ncbi:hypothetical protein EV421DRAFT_1742268 [Armillaria borealis]|uniref:Uncharacterized protein n=1 Tax=Armillaria borealis TaxID=47425 RepID=A0AA39MFN8_9AGAR|nr:hypothetical protein EV421DRAFT_1742268 [Armillaria borealis]
MTIFYDRFFSNIRGRIHSPAQEAPDASEVPIGFVFVHDGVIVAKARNRTNELPAIKHYTLRDGSCVGLPCSNWASRKSFTGPPTTYLEDMGASGDERCTSLLMDIRRGYHNSSLVQYNREYELAMFNPPVTTSQMNPLSMPHGHDSSGLPPEIYDAIIDELQDDKRSLLRVSLTCRALCPRTRVHLFSYVSLYNESSCSRLHELIALSPNLAPHFKSLCISITSVDDQDPRVYEAFTVIKSLVNLTQLTLAGGDWSQLPDTVVSSLQSHSYRSLEVYASFCFRAIGNICSLVQNSPDLQRATFACDDFTGDCHLNHSLHHTSAPVELHISDFAGSSVAAETLLKMATSFRSCPFSFRNIHTLSVTFSGQSRVVRQRLSQYLVLPGTSLSYLHYNSSETLDVSSLGEISVRLPRSDPTLFGRGSQIFEWWISNLSAVTERCAIRSTIFTIVSQWPEMERHPVLDWEDLWTRLDECLASYKMASLERVAITFQPRPAEWETYKIRMEGKFPLLTQLGRKLLLNATAL